MSASLSSEAEGEADIRSEEENDLLDDNLVSEFRQLYKGTTTTSTASVLCSSMDSLDQTEDPEFVKMKLCALKQYVFDLRQNYSELLKAFGQLESAAKQRISSLEQKLRDAVAAAKEFQKQSGSLQDELEAAKEGSAADAKRQSGSLEDALEAAEEGSTAEAKEGDPVQSGGLLEVRAGLQGMCKGMEADIESLQRQLASARQEHGSMVSHLEERNEGLSRDLCGVQARVASLECEVDAVTSKLEDSLQREAKLLEELTVAKDTGSAFQNTARGELVHREEELARLQCEVEGLRQQEARLVGQVEAMQREAQQLRDGHGQAEEEVQHLQKQVETLVGQLEDTDSDKQRPAFDEAKGLGESPQEKEKELATLLDSLQTATHKLALLSGRDGPEPKHKLEACNACDSAIQVLEEEISLHKEQWEKVTGALEYHKHCSEALQGREAGLQAELAQQEALVGELEGRLAQSMADQERLEGEAGVWRGREGEVRREAVSARQEALHEIEELTASAEIRENQLKLQREEKERELQAVVADGEEWKRQYEACCARVREEEKTVQALGKERDELAKRLKVSVERLHQLEWQSREKETEQSDKLKLANSVIEELKEKLSSKEEHWQGMQEEIIAKECLVTSLEDRYLKVVDQLAAKEQLLKQLEQNTTSLSLQHQNATKQVADRQLAVDGLREELQTSQHLCDTLKHEVSVCECELQSICEKLKEKEQEISEIWEAKVSELQQQNQDRLDAARRTADEKLKEAEEERRRLCEELNALQASVEESELQREGLLFQVRAQEGTVASLHSQVELLRETAMECEAQLHSAEAQSEAAQVSADAVSRQLSRCKERLVEMEELKSIAEERSCDKENEIAKLQQELEENGIQEGLVEQIRESMAALETQLTSIQEEKDRMETRNASCSSDLQEQLLKNKEQEQTVLQLEKELTQAQNQLKEVSEELSVNQMEAELAKCREAEWSSELVQCTAELQVSQEKAKELETALKRKEEESDSHLGELRAVKCIHKITLEELSANQEEEEGLRRELAESRELVSSMELQLTDYSEELKQLQSGLVEAEEERDSVLLRLSQLEDECEGLHRTHSRTESELLSTRGVLRDREAFCEEMKDECEAMSDHVTSWASDQRHTTGKLAGKIREQDSAIAALKAANSELLRENSSLKAGGSLSSQPSVTCVHAQLDFNISGAGPGTAYASVPLTFGSQYRSALEHGRSSICLEEPPHFRDRSVEHDKDFWLTVQLQQSSAYWSEKVRELSLQLEDQNSRNSKVD